jgi:hypothetical protein
MEKQNEMLKEAASLAEKVSSEVAERIGKIQTLSEPLNTFGEEVGEMLGEQWQGISREGKLTFGQLAKNMGLEYAKLTLKMATENLMKQVQQALFYKQMEAQAMAHEATLTGIQVAGDSARITAKASTGATLAGIKAAQDSTEIAAEGTKAGIMTAFGISEGAAKTIAKLGWWGIPLIGVISAILMGLLNSAMSTASTASSSSSGSTSANSVKTKLVSGMLTYDEGNIGTYQGTDGQSYHATQVSAPADGLVTRPIATTVQGQPALVAERGPEIVIGRRTTRAIMMNEPGLIKYLANYGRGAQAQGRYRAYDEGNLSDYTQLPDGSAAAQPAAGITADDAKALVAAIGAFNETVNQMQQKGIPCYINKYGTGGLIEEVKSGMKFDAKYNG